MESPAANASSPPCFCSVLNFLLLVGRLKRLRRTGWVLNGVRDCESVAEHSFRAAMCAMLIGSEPQSAKLIEEKKLNRDKCIKMALVHDLAESIVGDLTPYCGVSAEEKRTREREAMRSIISSLPSSGRPLSECPLCSSPDGSTRPPLCEVGEEILSLWEEYEEGSTEEAKFVFDIDKFEMILQAFEYESDPSQKGLPGGPPSREDLEQRRRGLLPEQREGLLQETEKEKRVISSSPSARLLLPSFYESTRGVFRSDLFRGLDCVLRKARTKLPQVQSVQAAAGLASENPA